MSANLKKSFYDQKINYSKVTKRKFVVFTTISTPGN